jgi:alpha-tubulin suppressor-like RCC1 family protein
MAGFFSWTQDAPVLATRIAIALSLFMVVEASASTNTSPPIIVQQPQSQTVPLGSDVTFSVQVTGTPPFSYRWRRNNSTILPPSTNTTGPTLTLFNVQTNQIGFYSVIVSNLYGTRLSSNAFLQVIPSGATNNLPPTVFINSPTNGAHFALGANIGISATTVDGDGYANRVEFFADNVKIGEQTFTFPPPSPPGQSIAFSFVWTNPPPGGHVLTARTSDDRGAIGVSPTVNIVVDPPEIVAARDDQEDPAIAGNGNGYLVVWADKRFYNSTEYDIYGARVSRTGAVIDPAGIPICRHAGRQVVPRVAFDGSQYLVVWADDRDSTPDRLLYQIYGARVTLTGVVRETNGFRITTNLVSNLEPAVASNGRGFFVVWTDWHRTTDAIADIYGTAVSSDGTVANPDGVPLVLGPLWQMTPRIASARGEYLVTFWGNWTTDSALHGLRLSSNGLVMSDVFPIDSGSAEGDRYDLASNGRDYLAVWSDTRNSVPEAPHIFGAFIRSNVMVSIPGGFPVSTNGNYQRRPTVASDGNNFVVVWQEAEGTSPDMTDLFGSRVTFTGVTGPRLAVNRVPGVQLNPAVGSTGTNFFVVWQDGRSKPEEIFPLGNYDIYGANSTPFVVVSNTTGVLVSGMSVEAPPVQDLDFQMTFFRPTDNSFGTLFTVDYTLEGPNESFYLLPAMRMAANGNGRYYYGTDGPGVRQATRVDSFTGQFEPVRFTPIAEDLGWEMGATYDSLRKRVLLVTLGGEGFLYALPDGQTEWIRLASMNNLDVDCLTYHAPADALYATKITHGEGVVIYELSPTGDLRKEIHIPDVPFDIAPGLHRSELVSVGEYLVLALEPETYSENEPYLKEARLYLIDPRTGDSWLTFRRVAMPPNRNPVVFIDSPMNDAEFQPGTDIILHASAYDNDGFIVSVEIFADGSSLGLAEAGDAGFTLRWADAEPGDHLLTAVATDNLGAKGTSGPVHIYVVVPSVPPPQAQLPLLVSGPIAHSAFFIDGSGQMFGTGLNAVGQMGGSNGLDVVNFKLMARPPGVRFWMGAAAQYYRSYAIGDDGMIYRWGVRETGEPEDADSVGALPEMLRLPAGVAGWSVVMAGSSHALALANNGQLYSWGGFGYGELGYEVGQYSTVPRRVPLPRGVQSWVSIAAGASHSLALANDGRLFAWGRNYEGELGNGSTAPGVTNPAPVIMPEGVTGWTKVIGGGQHTLALTTDGKLYGFGYNPYGISDGGVNPNAFPNVLQPVLIPFPPGVTRWSDAAAGIYHNAALTSDGRLFAWGESNYGQLGLGTVPGFGINSPTLVPFPSGVTAWRAIAAGFRHTLALGDNCQVYGTGFNAEGQLGIGHTNSAFVFTLAPMTHNGCEKTVNFKPTVAILSPQDGASVIGTNRVLIEARASDPDGTITRLSWYAGTNLLGSLVLDPPAPTAEHTLVWAGMEVGSYVLTVVARDNLGLSATSAPVRITVQSDFPIVTIRATDRFGSEEGMDPVAFTVTRTPVSLQPLLVRLSVLDTSRPNSIGLPIVSIPSGAASADYVFTPVDDAIYQGTRTIIASVTGPPEDSAPYQIGQPSSAQATIRDNDSPVIPVVTVTASDDEAAEGGTNFAVFTVRRDIVTTNSLYVVYSLRGTASNGVDYVSLPGYVQIPAGAGSAEVVVRPIDDSVVEGIESVTLELSSLVVAFDGFGFPPIPFYQVGEPRSAGAQILDNDRLTSSPVTLVATGSVWKYLTGTPAPAGWTDLAFDDAAWAAGPGQLGYGDGDEATVISFGPDPANKFITAYFRHAFRVSEFPIDDLTLDLLRDDGAIVYLNGVEVFRSNMPPGPVTYTTLASSGAADENAYLRVPLSEELLDLGEVNILAVEVHQVNVTSSDLGFDLALGGTIILPSGPDYPPYLNIYAMDALAAEYGVNGEIDPGAFRIVRDGSLRSDLTVDLLIDGDAVPGRDYVHLPSQVVIPAGVSALVLRVEPLKSNEAEPLESVRVTLVPPTCQPTNAGCYIVGGTNRATVLIKEFVPQWNNPPVITLVNPTNNASFWVGTTVPLMARAEDPDFPYGNVTQVQFLANGQSLGYGGQDSLGNWRFDWHASAIGQYEITAVATDGLGLTNSLSATSAPVLVTIVTAVAPACSGSWTNHTAYVRATIVYAWSAFRAGLITVEQRRTLIYEAVLSNCGRSSAPEPLEAHVLPLTSEECRRDGFQMIVTGDVTSPSVIECSVDFRQWTPVCTNAVTVTGREILCPTDATSRFYRVRLLP